MKAVSIYCQDCGKHTPHMPIVDMYANECMVCNRRDIALDRVNTEANKFYTPRGSEATLVSNTPETVVYSIDRGDEAGYYIYDKKSGFGAVQHRAM